MKKRIVDLFCGCGGMSLGFQNAGFEIVSAYDNWKAAVNTYKHNFEHPVYLKDISEEDIIPEIKQQTPDIIIGGPPCQDFSIAGKREFNGERANLTLIYSYIVAHIKPAWFVMENVYNIEKSPVFGEALAKFEEVGYGLTTYVFDASYMGVPQMRKRCFVIGKLGASKNFLLLSLLDGLSKERMTIRQYLGDSLGTDFYYMHPRSYNRRAIFSVDEPSSTIRGVNRPMPPTYKIHNADKTTDLTKVRSLSSKERSLIQTFPNDFVFLGSKSEVEQQIGNAVPVKMAQYIASVILKEM